MSSDRTLGRRTFVSAAASAMIVPRHVLGGPAYTPPSDKLNLAGVGVGGVGVSYLQECESENIVALADVDHAVAAKTFRKYPAAKTYRDFREMLEKQKDIDAVIIGTPDHTHAFVASAAMQLGKHVYCAKPMTRTVAEARRLTALASSGKLATQMSVQSCAGEEACTTEEIIRSGAIGAVREVHVWSDRPVWPQGIQRPKGTPPKSESLDWDLWLGPAPERPYHPIYHPFNWRGWVDFGTGALGDMALHSFHYVFRALNLGAPVAASSSTTVVMDPALDGNADTDWTRSRKARTPETFPHSSIVTWDFPAREGRPPVRLHWYDGGLKPPRPADMDPSEPLRSGGTYFVGDKGIYLVQSRENAAKGLFPQSRFRDFTLPPRTVARTIGHYREWIAAAKGGPPANCNFDFARLITETALLGVISTRTGKALAWDSDKMAIRNDASSNDLLRAAYRIGWSI